MSLASQIVLLAERVRDEFNITPRRRIVAIAYAASITPNCGTTDCLNVGELTGALTVNAPTGTKVDGQNLRFRFDQDATGRVITFASGAGAYAFGTDVTSALIPSTANAKFEIMFTWHAGDSRWRAVSLTRGF